MTMTLIGIGLFVFLMACYIATVREKHGQPVIFTIAACFINLVVRPIVVLAGLFSGLWQLRKRRK